MQDILCSRCHHTRVLSMMLRHLSWVTWCLHCDTHVLKRCFPLLVCNSIVSSNSSRACAPRVPQLSYDAPARNHNLNGVPWSIRSSTRTYLQDTVQRNFSWENFDSHSTSQKDISEISCPPEEQLSAILSWWNWRDDGIFWSDEPSATSSILDLHFLSDGILFSIITVCDVEYRRRQREVFHDFRFWLCFQKHRNEVDCFPFSLLLRFFWLFPRRSSVWWNCPGRALDGRIRRPGVQMKYDRSDTIGFTDGDIFCHRYVLLSSFREQEVFNMCVILTSTLSIGNESK